MNSIQLQAPENGINIGNSKDIQYLGALPAGYGKKAATESTPSGLYRVCVRRNADIEKHVIPENKV